VDPDARTIIAGGGCRWKDVDPVAGEHGLATPGGTISATGIGGFTLGGGLGFLAKLYGPSCDNLIDAEVVLADGSVVRANENDNPDLFWAIRGGGGNFGAVTSFTYRAYPVTGVTFGAFLWPASEAVDVFGFYRDYIPTTPPQVVALSAYLSAPPLPFVPPEMVGSDAMLIGVVYTGTPEEAQPVMQPILDRSPAASAIMPLPYPVVQQLLDSSAPDGMQNYWRSAFMNTPPDDALEVMAAAGSHKGSPLTMIQLINVGPSPDVDNAFPNREYPFLYHLIAAWPDPAENEQHMAWSRQLAQDLAPYASDGAYLNFTVESDPDRIRRAYGSKYDRLVEVKRRYDPDNVFRSNQNIAP
jgi:FAD/FMN-containing dehydrogenase